MGPQTSGSIQKEIKPHKCPYENCGYSSIKRFNVKTHIKTVHEKKKPYQCSHQGCEQTFSTNFNMQSHVSAVHEKKKPYHCSICPHKSATKNNLRSHIETVHEGKKPFKCTICGYEASKKSTIKNHLSVHEKEAIIVLFQSKMERNQIAENLETVDESSDSEESSHRLKIGELLSTWLIIFHNFSHCLCIFVTVFLLTVSAPSPDDERTKE